MSKVNVADVKTFNLLLTENGYIISIRDQQGFSRGQEFVFSSMEALLAWIERYVERPYEAQS